MSGSTDIPSTPGALPVLILVMAPLISALVMGIFSINYISLTILSTSSGLGLFNTYVRKMLFPPLLHLANNFPPYYSPCQFSLVTHYLKELNDQFRSGCLHCYQCLVNQDRNYEARYFITLLCTKKKRECCNLIWPKRNCLCSQAGILWCHMTCRLLNCDGINFLGIIQVPKLFKLKRRRQQWKCLSKKKSRIPWKNDKNVL